MFLTGQHVVCVDGNFPLGIEKYYTALPKEGKSYVVRGTAPGVSLKMEEGEVAVYLVGLINPTSNKAPYRERGFKCERFRSVDELTDEEIAGFNKPKEEVEKERELVPVKKKNNPPLQNPG